MVEYQSSAHAIYDIKYDVVWVTKYRHKILRGRVAERARDLIRQVCKVRNVAAVRGAAPPNLAPAKLVQFIKGRSSRKP